MITYQETRGIVFLLCPFSSQRARALLSRPDPHRVASGINTRVPSLPQSEALTRKSPLIEYDSIDHVKIE